jgi:amino acid adenylation domain-containing protein
MSREVFTRAQDSTELLHEFLLAPALLTPEKPAVVEVVGDEAGTVSYRQLHRRVLEATAAIDELGLDMGERVILESDTSAAAIVTFLACSALGLPFVAVSPECPAERLRSIIDDTRPALYLQSADGRRTGIPADVGTGSFGPDGVRIERAPGPRVRHRREVCAADPAYLVFTSGTTGRPKGVVMSHRGILAFYRGMLHCGIAGPEARVASTAPFQFDFSLLDIGLAFGSGASVVPVPRAKLRWPRQFLRFLSDTGATQVNGAPSIWRAALRHEPELLAELGSQIRGVLFSGEPFPLPELRRLHELLPLARVTNCFGSTESIACSFTDVPRPLPPDAERLSIGRAHKGAEMLLIDEEGEPIDRPDVLGQIHLRSAALFNGYWGDPEATDRALVPDPLSPRSGQKVFRTGDLAVRDHAGELYFVGRIDSQVKVHGNRVELAEVERRIMAFPGIAAATVLLVPRGEAEPVLCAFVTLTGDGEFDEIELAAFCLAALPDYMVPQQVRVLDEIPVNANGKVDRPALLAVSARTE